MFSDRLHLPTLAIDTIPGMALVEATRLLPIAFLTCQAALSRADSSLEDAARSAGARPLRVLTKITIPMLRPALLNSATLIFTLSIAALGIPLLLGTLEQHHVRLQLPLQHVDERVDTGSGLGQRRRGDDARSSRRRSWSRGTVCSAPRPASSRSAASPGGRRCSGSAGWRWPLAGVVSLYLVFTTLVPILGLALMSVVVVLTPLVPPWELLTSSSWHVLLDDPCVPPLDSEQRDHRCRRRRGDHRVRGGRDTRRPPVAASGSGAACPS